MAKGILSRPIFKRTADVFVDNGVYLLHFDRMPAADIPVVDEYLLAAEDSLFEVSVP